MMYPSWLGFKKNDATLHTLSLQKREELQQMLACCLLSASYFRRRRSSHNKSTADLEQS